MEHVKRMRYCQIDASMKLEKLGPEFGLDSLKMISES